MASAFSHIVAALAAGKLFTGRKMWLRFWLLGMFCAVVPDADVLAFKFGIPYEHPLGHRGFTHSLLFSVLLGLAVTWVFFRNHKTGSKGWWFLAIYFTFCAVSHAILDAITNGGLGVGFFIPFDNSRYFFPWQPVQVSPLGVANFFSERGWRVIKSELVWIWLPSAFIALTAMIIRRFRANAKNQKIHSHPNFLFLFF